MHFTERLEAPVPVAEAWEFIWQAERLAACLPGCVGVEELEPRKTYRARFADHVGPYKVQFDLDVAITESQPLQAIRLTASGRDGRLGVSQHVQLLVELHEAGPGVTALDVNADVEVIGKVATLGQFVIKRKAQDVVKQFARNLEAELRPPRGGGQEGSVSC